MRDQAQEVRELFEKMFGPTETVHRILTPLEEFPETLYLVTNPKGLSYQLKLKLADDWDGWGIVCFTTPEIADCFVSACDPDMHLAATEMSFDDARELAKSKMDVGCLFMMDDPDNIKVHWVR